MREKSGEENNDLYTIKRVSFRTAEKIRARTAADIRKTPRSSFGFAGLHSLARFWGFRAFSQLHVIELRVFFASRRFEPAPAIRIPAPLHVASSSCRDIRKIAAHPNVRARSSVRLLCSLFYHIIPGAPAGIAGAGSLMMATAASVVRKLDATLVAFWSALLVTLAGSRIPPSIMLTYSSL